MLFFNLWSVLQWYLRPFIKWFLRKTTGLCELQRICYGDKPGAERSRNVEKSLMLSRTRDVIQVVSYLDNTVLERSFVPGNFSEILNPSVAIILRAKKINPKLHDLFIVSFRRCLAQIWSYRLLLEEVEEMRKTHYNSSLPEHEEKLLKLWSMLVPNEDLESRVTKQWQYIGFQVSNFIIFYSMQPGMKAF